jgi:very-short-patch-repair endonuclease
MTAGKYETFGRAVDRCESPIERAFLVGLLFLSDTTFEPAQGCLARDSTGVELHQQLVVDGHRLDFALTRPGAALRFAVEIDGHAFHGATPEQFAHDSARQRAITARGWTFLRFSGREVLRDPRACAREAMAAAARMVDDAPAVPGGPMGDRPIGDPVVAGIVEKVRAAEAAGDWDEAVKLASESGGHRAQAPDGDCQVTMLDTMIPHESSCQFCSSARQRGLS